MITLQLRIVKLIEMLAVDSNQLHFIFTCELLLFVARLGNLQALDLAVTPNCKSTVAG